MLGDSVVRVTPNLGPQSGGTLISVNGRFSGYENASAFQCNIDGVLYPAVEASENIITCRTPNCCPNLYSNPNPNPNPNPIPYHNLNPYQEPTMIICRISTLTVP